MTKFMTDLIKPSQLIMSPTFRRPRSSKYNLPSYASVFQTFLRSYDYNRISQGFYNFKS